MFGRAALKALLKGENGKIAHRQPVAVVALDAEGRPVWRHTLSGKRDLAVRFGPGGILYSEVEPGERPSF